MNQHEQRNDDTTPEATGWDTIRLAYVHGRDSMAMLARAYGVSAEAVQKRASREGWTALRQQVSDSVTAAATERISAMRAEQLAQANAADLATATRLREHILATLDQAGAGLELTPAQIRQLVAAAEGVQRVGRLALGASTDNQGLSGPGGQRPMQVEQVPLKAYEESLARLLAAI